jgi:hypothetical protein
MAEKKFIIEVRTKGFTRATRSVRDLEKNTKDYNRAADNMRGQTRGLIANLGSLRNKILVYSFALGGAVAVMNKFVQAASGFEDVRARLVGLTGGVDQAEKAFLAFNEIAKTTPFALQDVVNAGAQLEAFGLNSELTLQATSDLAAFMGTTATEAASALGRAFAGGAGAADILRERGILQLIKDSQGITDLTKITLPEFRKALIDAMTDPDGRISGSADRLSETFTGAFTNMQDAITTFAATIGSLVSEDLKALVNGTEDFFRSLDIKRLKEFTTTLATFSFLVATFKFGQFIVGLNKARIATMRLNAMMATASLITGKFSKAIIALAGILTIDFFVKRADLFDDLSESIDDNANASNNAKNELEKYKQGLLNTTTAVDGMNQSVLDSIKKHKSITESYQNQLAALLAQEAAMDGANLVEQERIKNMGFLSIKTEETIKQIEIVTARINERTKAEKALSEQEKARIKRQNDNFIALAAMEQDRTNRNEAAKKALEDLNKEVSENLVVNMEESADHSDSLARGILLAAGAMKTLRDESATTEQKMSTLLATLGSVLMMTPGGQIPGAFLTAGSMFVGHTGGLIKNNGIQRFANGGQVQGEDDVPILAQAGEFIMKRSAVQNIGVQNLANMNRTGNAGGVTINISGNMIGNDEFVRDNLIPEIQKVSNQGLA